MRTLYDRLRDTGGPLNTEAADVIDELESDAERLRGEVRDLEREAGDLRQRVQDLEAARLCRPCAFGTIAHEPVFCTACGGKR